MEALRRAFHIDHHFKPTDDELELLREVEKQELEMIRLRREKETYNP